MEEYFNLPTEDGSEQRCRVVITFDTDDHSYVVFTIVDEDGNESEEVSVLRYELDEDGRMANFTPLESEEEWEMADEVLNTLVDEFSEGDQNFFTVTDENDEEVVCRVLHRFELEEFEKAYVLYTFNDSDKVEEIFAAAYIEGENGEITELLPIDSDEEWAKVEEELASLDNK